MTSYLIWLAASLLGCTWRITVGGSRQHRPDKKRPVNTIFSFWHSNLLTISFAFRNSGVTALVSGSNDGRIAAKVARLWKHAIIVGSSSHGGLDALRRCVRVLARNRSIGITPDGPRGPKQHVKPGVAQMAIMAEASVVVLSVTADRYWRFRSWDGFTLPKPFARVHITVAPPLPPPKKGADRETVESFRETIEKEMLVEHPLAT